jgi:hypothetical protein
VLASPLTGEPISLPAEDGAQLTSTSLFAPRVPSLRANIGSSASVGSLVAPSVGHTPKYDQHQFLGRLSEHPY